MSDRIDEASAQVQEILKKAPQDPDGLVLKGNIQVRQGRAHEAVTTLEDALKSAPQNAWAHYHLSVAFSQKANTQQAESEWRECVRLRPTLAEAWVALGRSAMQRSDWRTLEDIANQLKKYAPNSILQASFDSRPQLD
jgi:predicted Zn-dependent protease